jgi:XTP/dITP diphosphohydrolase
MKIVLASRNKKKKMELQTLLSEYIEGIEILSLDEVGIYGEIEEDGATFEENALIKARTAAESGYIGIGDDSGLEVDSLGGAPGVYSARYAGGHGDDEANNALLLKKLEDKADRGAHYTCAMALVFPSGKEVTAEGYMYGDITKDPRGTAGFGYDPLFVPTGEIRTVAEMTDDEKNAISHRANALNLLLEKL